ncbi:ester cyclase [Natronococcus pandeyae]|nr:ester cyclase [Natronococcus pandeyae]
MTTPEEKKELVVRGSFEPYTEGNVDAIDEAMSEDYVLHDPASREKTYDREGFKEHVESFRTAFPDLSATIEHMVVEDDLVMVHFTVGGTHEGPLPDLDLEPTGEKFEITGMETDRIEDGELAETWLVYDSFGFAEQLGAIPETDTPARQ